MPSGIYKRIKPSYRKGKFGIYHLSKSTKKKISISNKGQIPWIKGKHHSEETRKKIGLAGIGRIKSQETIDKIVNSRKGYRHSLETIKKIKEKRKLQIISEETRLKMSLIHKGNKNCLGRKQTKEERLKNSLAHRGNKSSRWKGGITLSNLTIRNGIEIRLWRESVFARDSWTCQKTGERGEKLECHHINNFADFPELRTSIENGITLLKKVHKEFHHIYGVKNNTKEQLIEFLNN